MNKDVMLVVGAGQLSLAIARRMGYGKKLIVADKSIANAQSIADVLMKAGFDSEAMAMDL